MASLTVNHEIVKGDYYALLLALRIDGVSSPIAGWSEVWLTAKLHKTDTDEAALFQLKMGSGISVFDAVSWLAEVQPEHTASAVPGRCYFYDVQGRDPNGKPQTLEVGYISIADEITTAS